MRKCRLPVRLAAVAVLLVTLPAARCQQRSASVLPRPAEEAQHWAAPEASSPHTVEAVYQPSEEDESARADEDRDLADFADYEALLSEAAVAWLAQQQQQQEQSNTDLPSSLRSPNGAPSRGILEQLLQRPSSGGGGGGGGGGQGDLGSLFSSLLSSQAGGGGGAAGLAALLTTTTARPTRIFDQFVIHQGNPFATQRPQTTAGGATQNPLAAVTAKTTDGDDEADKFDAGFQIFSQIFSGNNAVDGPASNGFADAPALQLTTATTTRATPPPPTAPTAPAAPPGWPFYTTPRPRPTTTSRQPPPPPPPPQPQPQPQNNFNNFNTFNNKLDTRPTRAPRPPGVPFYYNPDAPPAGPPPPPEPQPQIKLGVLLSSVTQLVRSDGPSMLAALGDAYGYIQEGNILGLLQGVIPVFSRATPVFMNMLNSVAPVLEKSDIYGPPIPGSPGIGGLFGSLSGLFGGGRRRPLRRRQPLNRNTPPGYSQPYYMGQVIGSGMKMITYLINHGTTVVRAREPSDFGWVRDAIGEENAEFLWHWIQRVASSQS